MSRTSVPAVPAGHPRLSLHSEHTMVLPATVLRSVVVKMHGAFPKLCKEWNVRSCMRKNWERLFEHMDTDGSGRLHFEEFVEAVGRLGDLDVTPKHPLRTGRRGAAR